MKVEGEGAATEYVSDLARGLSEALRGTVEPVREQLARIDEEIARRETELKELRVLRTNGRRMIAIFDPDVPVRGRKPGVKPSTSGGRPQASQDRMDALAGFLREQYPNGDSFTVPEVAKRSDFKLMSRATVDAAMHQLTDAGVVRLDHLGRAGVRHYKLVGDGTS